MYAVDDQEIIPTYKVDLKTEKNEMRRELFAYWLGSIPTPEIYGYTGLIMQPHNSKHLGGWGWA